MAHTPMPRTEDLPLVKLQVNSGYTVDETYDCPLRKRGRRTSFGNLKAAAEGGCPVCAFQHHAIVQCYSGPLTPRSDVPTFHDSPFSHIDVRNAPWKDQWIEFFIEGSSPGASSLLSSLDTMILGELCNFNNKKVSLPPRKLIPPGDTSSTKSLCNAVDWIQDCDRRHGCRSSAPQRLPKRIISISEGRVVLCEPQDEIANYVCLSHCWGQEGKSDVLRTTKNNLDTFKKGIPWESLPKTFQDSIHFTRRFGLKYIWIDSLCIVQDDDLEWQQESSKMATIYRNSYLTLAAAAGSSPDAGCFTPKDLRDHDAINTLATVHYPNGVQHNVYARRRLPHAPQHFPLLKRAWVYQERFLSPRVLYFAGYELIWECAEALECECGLIREGTFRRPSISRRYLNPRVSTELMATVIPWQQIVEQYSCLDMTYPKDVFPALSGLAKNLAVGSKNRYIAGLWYSSILPDLLWYRAQEPRKTIRAVPWRAPTWSWASSSSNERVLFLPTRELLADVIEAESNPKGADPTGELSSAHIVLRARGILTSLQVSKPKNTPTTIYLSNYYSLSIADVEFKSPCTDVGSPPGDLGILFKDSKCRIEPIPSIHIIQVGRNKKKKNMKATNFTWGITVESEFRHFMVLKLVKGDSGKEETYERIGLLSIDVYKDLANINDLVVHMSRDEIERHYEAQADRIRKVFQAFDEAPMKDYKIV